MLYHARSRAKELMKNSAQKLSVEEIAHIEWTRAQIEKCGLFGIYFMLPFSAVFLPAVLKLAPGFVPEPFLFPEQKVFH
jgi:hypothetical protein